MVAVRPALAATDAACAVVGIQDNNVQLPSAYAECALVVWLTPDRVANLVGDPEAAARLKNILAKPVRIAAPLLVGRIAQEILSINSEDVGAYILLKSCIFRLFIEIESEILLEPKEKNSIFLYKIITDDPIGVPPLDDLAKGLGVSVWKMNRDFRGMYGISIHSFIVQRKMKWSYDKISMSSMLIKEISKSVGYRNTSNFSYAFSKYFGASPNDLRSSGKTKIPSTRYGSKGRGCNDE